MTGNKKQKQKGAGGGGGGGGNNSEKRGTTNAFMADMIIFVWYLTAKVEHLILLE